MDFKKIEEFLIELRFNNNRNWFKENNEKYQNAKNEFENFIQILIPKIKQIDKGIDVENARECTFRIYKDVRFSKEKIPYKTNFGAYISRGGRKSPFAGYYIHYEPDASFVGGGVYMPQSSILKAIRTAIFEDTEEYKGIINNKKFKSYFPGIYGEKLKSAPRGFPKDFADLELIKNKHFAVTHKVENSFWHQENLIDNVLNVFKVQYEFNSFLNRVVNV